MKRTVIAHHEKENTTRYLTGTEDQIRAWLAANGGEKAYLVVHPGDRLYSMLTMLAGDSMVEL